MTDPYRTGSPDQGTPPEDPMSSTGGGGSGSADPARTEPAIRQLDTMIENVANYAAPVLREIAARAAELAAKAGQAAGPMAHRAAEKTEQVGGRLATRGREVASDLRRESGDRSATGSTGSAGSRSADEDVPQG
jgi:hypothetical protein